MTLRLNGTSSGFTEIDAPAAAGSNKITLPTSNGSAEQFLKNSGTAGELEFSSMVETSTGIGIGTSSPSAPLDVVGNDGIAIQSSSQSNEFLIRPSSSSADGIRFTQAGGGGDRMAIDSAGRLLINHNADTAPQGYESKLQLCDTSYQGSSLLLRRDGGTSGPVLLFAKSRGTSKGAHTVIQDGDNLGTFRWFAADGTDTESEAAQIRAQVDDTPGSNDTPGRIVFSTTANGSNSVTERMRITSVGYLKVSNDASYIDAGHAAHEFNNSGATEVIQIRATNSSYSSTTTNLFATRSSTSAYWFIRAISSSGSASADTEFYIRGDGNAFADGTWSGGGADYAEYFEWSDGNTEAEDRRGISVVLDGDKIREAVAGEEPIGVISGNPSVIGDGDMDRWKGKYLRDDFGTYLLDTHNVVEWDETITDDEGNESTKKHSYEDWNIPAGIVVPTDAVVSATDENGQPYTHRRLNPDYNPDTAYVSRENRAEWDTVGLMGKLRIRKGQVTGARWIKMRDVSDTVEEWLVR